MFKIELNDVVLPVSIKNRLVVLSECGKGYASHVDRQHIVPWNVPLDSSDEKFYEWLKSLEKYNNQVTFEFHHWGELQDNDQTHG